MVSIVEIESWGAPTPPPIVPPTRAQVCGVKMTFAGLTVQTSQYGALPWFEPAISSLSAADRQAVYAAKKTAGDTHLNLAWSWNYAEPGQPYGSGNRVPPCDLSQVLATLRGLIEEGIHAGFFVYLTLAGDGQGNGPGYNDPVGWTYGHDWLMSNFGRLVAALRASVDLTPWILFVPGYDGVFYGWTPQQVQAFGALFRSLLPDGYLGIEHDIGHIPVGNGAGDYAAGGMMTDYDVILGEFAYPQYQADSTWQVLGRMVRPYHRPPQQPANDDPNPPFYLAPNSPRGPYYYIAFEIGEYQWVRNQVTAAQLAQAGADFSAMGATFTCLP